MLEIYKWENEHKRETQKIITTKASTHKLQSKTKQQKKIQKNQQHQNLTSKRKINNLSNKKKLYNKYWIKYTIIGEINQKDVETSLIYLWNWFTVLIQGWNFIRLVSF